MPEFAYGKPFIYSKINHSKFKYNDRDIRDKNH